MSDNATCATSAVALAPASIIGRIGKFSMGTAQLLGVYSLGTAYAVVTLDTAPASVGLWIFAGLAFGLLSWTVNIAFRRTWGAKPFYVAIGLAAAGALYGFATAGIFWSLPFALVVYVVTMYVHAHMGFCHVLAALLATPGCEMRSINHLFSKLTGNKAALQICPGIWTPIDNWEARIRHRGPDSAAVS